MFDPTGGIRDRKELAATIALLRALVTLRGLVDGYRPTTMEEESQS